MQYLKKQNRLMDIILKMKVLGLALLPLVRSILSPLPCGEGAVASSNLGICIRPDYIEGCQQYLNETSCAVCQEGYSLDGTGYCTRQEGAGTHLPGCLQTNSVGHCLNCANGFRRLGTACAMGLKNCLTYTADGKCERCKLDYSLLLGQCRHNVMLGCKHEEEGHYCQECYQPFQLRDGACEIAHCKNYNDFGCTSCECGYFLQGDRCVEVSEGCLRYSQGECVDCLPHYHLSGGSCQILGCQSYNGAKCEHCGENFQPTSEGGCRFVNCLEWNNQRCLVCEQGFVNFDGKCKELPPSQCQI